MDHVIVLSALDRPIQFPTLLHIHLPMSLPRILLLARPEAPPMCWNCVHKFQSCNFIFCAIGTSPEDLSSGYSQLNCSSVFGQKIFHQNRAEIIVTKATSRIKDSDFVNLFSQNQSSSSSFPACRDAVANSPICNKDYDIFLNLSLSSCLPVHSLP